MVVQIVRVVGAQSGETKVKLGLPERRGGVEECLPPQRGEGELEHNTLCAMEAIHQGDSCVGCMWRTEVTTKFREAGFRGTFCTLGTTTIRLSFQKANSEARWIE